MKKTKEEVNLCLSEIIQKIETYRENSQRKAHLIPYEEDIRRAKAFCRLYWITECSKSLGIGYNTFLKWLKTRKNSIYINTRAIAAATATKPLGASTNFADVTHVVPSIHPVIAIAPEGATLHCQEFAEMTFTESGHRGLEIGAKAMAAVEILADAELLEKNQGRS